MMRAIAGQEHPATPELTAPGASFPGNPGAARSFGMHDDSAPIEHCIPTIADLEVASQCIPAVSAPTLGSLYPLSDTFIVRANASVGIGTIAPGGKVDVLGNIRANRRLISTMTGEAPVTFRSTPVSTNSINDTLDGLDMSVFSHIWTAIETPEQQTTRWLRPRSPPTRS